MLELEVAMVLGGEGAQRPVSRVNEPTKTCAHGVHP